MKLRSLLNMIAVLLFSFSIATAVNPFSAQAATIIGGDSGVARATVLPPATGSIEISAGTENIPDNAPGVLPFINNSGRTVIFSISGQKIKVNGDTARWDYGTDCQSGLTGDGAELCGTPAQLANMKCKTLRGGALFSELKTSTNTSCALVGYRNVNIAIPNGAALRIFNNDVPGSYGDNSGTAVLNYSWDFQK